MDRVRTCIEAPYHDKDKVKEKEEVAFYRAAVSIHAYRASPEPPADEVDEDEHDGSKTTLFSIRPLPSLALDDAWDALHVESSVKRKLLSYSRAAVLLADRRVPSALVSCNRVVLLFGPPGTGKTTLAQAVAQKLSVRLTSTARYSGGAHLVEVNAHSLFSRWFSESGKLVSRMFDRVRDLANDPTCLVFVLIDEVESLTAARNAQANEPSDAMRVVNAMLTQLDRLKELPNVLVLATSNITGAVDAAFLDRADLKIFLGPPNLDARFEILSSGLHALVDAGVAGPRVPTNLMPSKRSVFLSGSGVGHATGVGPGLALSGANKWLALAAEASEGLSGRALRKLPLTAVAACLDGSVDFGKASVVASKTAFKGSSWGGAEVVGFASNASSSTTQSDVRMVGEENDAPQGNSGFGEL